MYAPSYDKKKRFISWKKRRKPRTTSFLMIFQETVIYCKLYMPNQYWSKKYILTEQFKLRISNSSNSGASAFIIIGKDSVILTVLNERG